MTATAPNSNNGQQKKGGKEPPATIRDEHVLVAMAMAPLRGTQRAYRHLSSVKGFGIVASLMTVYCAGLSTESIAISMPSAARIGEYSGVARTATGTAQIEALRRQRRFIPKPYVDDGAELGRLNPIPNIQRSVLQNYFQWLPLWIKGAPKDVHYWTVWNAPAVMGLAIIFSLVIQRFEAMVWRKKTSAQTKADFLAANNLKQVAADPQAIALASYKAAQHNAQGMGGMLFTFVTVVFLYGLEIAAFAGSFAGAGNWVVNALYAGLSIFGFEAFDRLGDD